MNSNLRQHHLPGQPDDPTSTSQNGFGDDGTGPANTLSALDTGNLGAAFSTTTAGAAAVLATASPVGSSSGAIAEASGTGHSGAFVINASYDSSITSIQFSDPTLYSEFTGAVQAAISYYEGIFTNAMTINITFGLGSIGGAGQSNWSYSAFGYTTFYNDLKNAIDAPGASVAQKDAFLSLPASDPTNGAGVFVITGAEQEALGLTTNPASGTVVLSDSLPFSWTQPNTNGNNYDAVGTLEHEISEVMGRADFLGSPNPPNIPQPEYSLLDFFHYSAAGNNSNAAFGSAPGILEQPFAAGYSSSVQPYFYDPVTGKITLAYDPFGAGDVADWKNTVQSDSFGSAINGETGLVSPTDLEELNILGYDMACFLPGTRIVTPSGEVAVENLAVGDMIRTYRGEEKSITWIGRGKALATRGQRNAATPVIVHKGALADNVPNRELRITKGHSLYLDGVLIPAEFLVNHRSIVWDDRAQEVEVYHIELAEHDVLLANGAPAESYRDDGNRWLFQNANSGWDMAAKPPCAPVMTGGPVVDAIWHRVLARSGPRPGLPLTSEPDLHLMVDGRRVDGLPQPNGALAFRLTTQPTAVHIVSRAGAQDELGLARDPRALGVALRQIVLWQGRHPTLVAGDDPRLCDGFHGYEADNDFRWTNGDAALPANIFEGISGPFDVELHVGSTTHYPLFEDQTRAAA